LDAAGPLRFQRLADLNPHISLFFLFFSLSLAIINIISFFSQLDYIYHFLFVSLFVSLFENCGFVADLS